MAWMASLRAAQGNATGAQRFSHLARSVALDTVENLYIPGGNGTWGCMYTNGTVVAVRHVIDFLYVTRGLHVAALAVGGANNGNGGGLDDPVAARAFGGFRDLSPEMAALFHRELETPTWVRALSLDDDLARRRSARAQMILRPDHGITGGSVFEIGLEVE